MFLLKHYGIRKYTTNNHCRGRIEGGSNNFYALHKGEYLKSKYLKI